MMRPRVIPVLLLRDRQLCKTRRFKAAKYVGDPRNAVKIFNDKGVDEIILLDIDATPQGREPDIVTIGEIASEAFMPMGYGGGVRTVDQARRIFDIGVEKIATCAAALENLEFVEELARIFGSQSIVVCLDVRKGMFGRQLLTSHSGRHKAKIDPVAFARRAVDAGAGELVVNAVHQDGEMTGYDLGLIRSISGAVDVPVIAVGGAGNTADLRHAIEAGASAAAAGSMFVFQGPHRAVLITFPEDSVLNDLFADMGARR